MTKTSQYHEIKMEYLNCYQMPENISDKIRFSRSKRGKLMKRKRNNPFTGERTKLTFENNESKLKNT